MTSVLRMKKSVVGSKSVGRRRKIDREQEDNGDKVFHRVEKLGQLSNKAKNLRPSHRREKERFGRRDDADTHPCNWKKKRADASSGGGQERKLSVRGQTKRQKKCAIDVEVAEKGIKTNDARKLSRKPVEALRRVIDGHDSDYEHTSRDSLGTKERTVNHESSVERIELKRRKTNRESVKNVNVDDNDELEKHSEKKYGAIQTSEQRIVKRLTRVLDKSGKKIRVQKNPMVSDMTVANTSRKKSKRVIKIDPYDISNKRLVDLAPRSERPVVVKDVVVSQNAQFRAIQPSDEILSLVEDNLMGRRRLNELKNCGYNIKLSAPLDNIPFSTGTERENIEENVFRNKLQFFAAAKISSSFPPPTIPEIAFAGRSNVGKSSLLNSLTRQWGVVRTSDKPGLTQTINFFKLASKLCLVDLPGYGFAYAKEEVKDAWEELVKEYVSTRVGLERVCLLVDTQWGMKQRDYELIELMERSKTSYQIVLTKTDIVFPIDVARRAMQIQENLKKNKSIVNPLMMVSSKSGAGIRHLRTVLAKLARFVKP